MATPLYRMQATTGPVRRWPRPPRLHRGRARRLIGSPISFGLKEI